MWPRRTFEAQLSNWGRAVPATRVLGSTAGGGGSSSSSSSCCCCC
eukprot:CAMPEP_0206557924 /NCGR_PEP_ID=MMETSP0325_2-20121206/19432_1 /ASSEMBLY_ACC=CAM_ASM_000347 /TAXON_ID=2866 /ORGANISM="Crypthecodinium cohnii, Strain Seligo" /LENGTH=44 /DNA_ID= /DNA_START= /DNA_END= /DNA_ORIENTATION=